MRGAGGLSGACLGRAPVSPVSGAGSALSCPTRRKTRGHRTGSGVASACRLACSCGAAVSALLARQPRTFPQLSRWPGLREGRRGLPSVEETEVLAARQGWVGEVPQQPAPLHNRLGVTPGAVGGGAGVSTGARRGSDFLSGAPPRSACRRHPASARSGTHLPIGRRELTRQIETVGSLGLPVPRGAQGRPGGPL